MKRILVARGGAIGDFVLTLPALKLLRDGYPRSRIEILGYKQIVALAEGRFYADAVRSIEYGPLASFFARGAQLPSELADYFHSFDLVISYLFDPDRIFERNVLLCGVDNFIFCNPKVTGDEHAAIQLARPLAKQVGLSGAVDAAQIFPSSDDRDFAAKFLARSTSPIIALHPGSGSATKNWPVERWRQLGDQMLAANDGDASLVIVGGEADGAALGTLRSAWREGPVRFAENLPLPQLAAVLARAALFIGHDSGISHIAAAVGTPCVLLFGPTDPDVWAPRNSRVRVVAASSGHLTDLSVEEVFRSVQATRQREGSPALSS